MTLRSILSKSDRASAFAIAEHIWKSVAGLVTLTVVALFLSENEQGLYFTFGSVVAVGSIVELGFYLVIVNTASHERAVLTQGENGQLEGDIDSLSRLSSLFRLVVRWYMAGAVILACVVGPVGHWFFGQTQSEVEWQAAWFVLISTEAVVFCLIPLVSLLEGCNLTRDVYRQRFLAAVLSSVAFCSAAILGAGLWAVIAAPLVHLLVMGHLVFITHRRFFVQLTKNPQGKTLSWRRDLWPFQWKVAITVGFAYLSSAVINPIVFQYEGVKAAGKVGLTLAAVMTIRGVGSAWVATKVPGWGQLVALGKLREFDVSFFRFCSRTGAVLLAAGVAFVALVIASEWLDLDLRDRLLSPTETVLFVLAALGFVVTQYEATYLRVFKTEPAALLNPLFNCLIGAALFAGVTTHGTFGLAVAYAGVMLTVIVPARSVIWHHYRHVLHKERENENVT